MPLSRPILRPATGSPPEVDVLEDGRSHLRRDQPGSARISSNLGVLLAGRACLLSVRCGPRRIAVDLLERQVVANLVAALRR